MISGLKQMAMLQISLIPKPCSGSSGRMAPSTLWLTTRGWQSGAPRQLRPSGRYDGRDVGEGLSRNLTTAFLVTRAALPGMKARGWGRIINIASTTGAVAGVAGDSAYAAAKAGMLGMSRALCLEVATHGVTVNCVAPGWIATGSQTEAEVLAGNATPIGRSGRPEEVAGCVAYLNAAAPGITGQLIVVDGGNSVLQRFARSHSGLSGDTCPDLGLEESRDFCRRRTIAAVEAVLRTVSTVRFISSAAS